MGSSSTLCPPEDAWILAHQKLLPQWQSLTLSSHQSTIPISISRVNQFDAARLDIEMSAMLKEQLVKVFSLMKPGMLFQYEPELDAFLEFLIWRFSIWVDKPTPGNALMNLRYRDDRAVEPREKVRTGLEQPGLTVAQKIWYCIATVGGQYIWARLQSFSAFRRWGDSEQRPLARRAWILIQIEGLYKAASFGNLLFSLHGKEMLLLLLPLLNSSSVKNLLSPFPKDKSSSSTGDNGTATTASEHNVLHLHLSVVLNACNSTVTGGMCKKPRVQQSSTQPPLKVRKEKLGDRITALHQLVSPFGKTDTASVLLEAIGYIRFLQGQIEALSSPYLGSSSSNMRNQQSVQGERNSVFPEDPGQLLNDICLKRKGGSNLQDSHEMPKDLRSRGLCLVPVSCTQHVGSDNGADYWAPAIAAEGFEIICGILMSLKL
ncbi:hypothetical protein GH714_035525 [Hevea brasiliensis]|uniref:RING-type E3 ubiquitin transferase (cysteine targeting) n=1 Tax=Hevea brasiliensis TaxID=3981 RepID=A0A6A6NEA5_HEVBR|nr:hypothetical protein GH714_035525 [Hevea brasiliensis]